MDSYPPDKNASHEVWIGLSSYPLDNYYSLAHCYASLSKMTTKFVLTFVKKLRKRKDQGIKWLDIVVNPMWELVLILHFTWFVYQVLFQRKMHAVTYKQIYFFKRKEEVQESTISFFVWVISCIKSYRTKGINLVLCSGLLHKSDLIFVLT